MSTYFVYLASPKVDRQWKVVKIDNPNDHIAAWVEGQFIEVNKVDIKIRSYTHKIPDNGRNTYVMVVEDAHLDLDAENLIATLK